MNARFLFPHRLKKWGWGILGFSVLLMGKLLLLGDGFDLFKINTHNAWLAFLSGGQSWVPDDLTLTISGALLIIGAFVVAFSKLKVEDEFSSRIRLESLQWAVYLSYALLLAAFLLLYGINFVDAMFYNMFTVLVVFIVRFHWVLFRQNRFARHEK